MDDVDEVWNRAAAGGGENPQEGDRALADALALHSLVMNGGVLHALEVLTADEVGRAREGFAWLGRPDIANYLETTQAAVAALDPDDDAAVDALESEADDGYDALVPDDDATLEAALRTRIQERPGAFAPVA